MSTSKRPSQPHPNSPQPVQTQQVHGVQPTQSTRPAQPVSDYQTQQVQPSQQVQPVERRTHRRPIRSGPSTGPIVGLVIVFVILLGMMIYQTWTKDQLQTAHAQTVEEYNQLKGRYEDLSNRVSGRTTSADGSGQPLAASAMSERDLKMYVAQLERDLAASDKTAMTYWRAMTTEQQNALRRRQDVYVQPVSVSNTGENHEVKIIVVNGSDTPARDVGGVVRFWYDNRIVYNLPFSVPNLAPRSQQPLTLTMPSSVEFSDFQGYITARPDNAGS